METQKQIRKNNKECQNNITKSIEKNDQKWEKNFNVVKLPWIPKLEPKFKTRFRKFSIKTVLKSK